MATNKQASRLGIAVQIAIIVAIMFAVFTGPSFRNEDDNREVVHCNGLWDTRGKDLSTEGSWAAEACAEVRQDRQTLVIILVGLEIITFMAWSAPRRVAEEVRRPGPAPDPKPRNHFE